jgi:ketosteroid isomerase-like protein
MRLLKQVEHINDAIVRGDLDGLLTHYADDVRFVTPSGVIDGRPAFRDHFAAVLSSVHDLTVTTTWAIELRLSS